MNSLPTRAILGAGTAATAAVVVATAGSSALALGLASLVATTAVAAVALATQLGRLREEQRLVYRPVYVRRQGVQRRVRSDD